MLSIKHAVLIGTFCLTSAAMAQTYQGELEVLVFDNFTKHQSKTEYKLHEGNQVYSLDLPSSINKNELHSGLPVFIEGKESAVLTTNSNNGGFAAAPEKSKTIKVQSIMINTANIPDSSKANQPVDSRKILTLILNFTDKKTSNIVSIADVDSILYKSNLSMLRNFQRDSFNQLTFVRPVGNAGDPGIAVVNINHPLEDYCNYQQWAVEARTAATQNGVNLNLYRHFMFVIPQDVKCDWGGLGQLGCGASCNTWIRGYNPKLTYSQLVYTHEMGHNLGMNHSATDLNNDGRTDSEYGDAACIMGTGDFQYFSELNAPHRDQMGWLDSMPNRVKTVVASGQFTLSALDAGMDNNGVIVLKIAKNARETYYVSFRKNIGPFGSGSPDYLDKVSIHRTVIGDTHTYFIKALKTGESFTDPKNNITITAIRATDSAVVSVQK